MPRNTPELDPRLAQLYGLNQMNQAQESAGTENTAAIVKMLADLYGISQAPSKLANETDLAHAHANYYNTETESLTSNKKAESVMRNAAALRSMAEAGLPRGAVEAQARAFGFVVPEPVKPKGEFGPGSAAPKPPELAIPPEYANDPEFKALQPHIQQQQKQESANVAGQAERARQAALEKLRRKLNIDTGITSGIPGYLH